MVAAFVRSTSLRACATLVRPAYGTVPSIAACATPQYRRALSHSSQKAAEVADVSLDSSSAASGSSSKDHSAAQKTDHAIRSTREALEKKKEQKFAEYEELLKQKAASQGFGSVEEMQRKRKEDREASKATEDVTKNTFAHHDASLSEADAKVAAEIRSRVEAEAKRKLETGDFSSGPGKLKTLRDIIDVDRLSADSPSKITQLWTQYHTLKNKLSAVIPAKQYAEMVAKARQYPQFILPLPRTIVGSIEGDTANVAPGERKQGYEMQYMEWGFLPKPASVEDRSGEAQDMVEQLTPEEKDLIAKTPPSTVLFTPLAEYKLRQEYAQPVLVLSHFTELASSKGIVLLRGEVTGADEAAVAPTGIAAATAASKAGETSAEKLSNLQKPLQSQGKLSQQDAQLLTVTLQRFYMPKAPGVDTQPGEEERQGLLDAFHGDQERFDIDALCKTAFLT